MSARKRRRAEHVPRMESSSSASAPSPLRRLLVPALASLVVAAGLWAYSTSFGGVFVFDDTRAIVENPTIQTLWPLSVPLSPPVASTVSGRPVANLSFAISYAAGPGIAATATLDSRAAVQRPALDPTPFHVGNLLIHLAAALALLGVVRRTLSSPRLRDQYGPAASWLALAVALIWAVHPLNTGAVTYVVQRVESLMGLFYLLTLYCAIRARGGPHPRLWTAASIACCACGMATKEVMVTAPIVVALWDWLFGVPGRRETSRARWGYYAGLAATWIVLGILVFHERRSGSVTMTPSAVQAYFLTQAEVVLRYLRLAFIPAPLVLMYDWPPAPSFMAVAWQATLLAVLVVLTAVAVVRRHPGGFLGAWFFLILTPSSSVVPIVTEVAAEHRMYLPLAAVIAAVVIAAFALGRTLFRDSKAAVAAGVAAVAIAAGLLGVETRARNRVYWSVEGLWQDTVAKRPDDARSRIGYAEMLVSAGRLAEAEAQLRVAVEHARGRPLAFERLGAVLAQQNRLDAAIPYFESALAVQPDNFYAHRFLADIFALRRRDGLAVEHYERALARVPDDASVTARLAGILADSSDLTVRDARRALALAERAVSLTSGQDPRILEILSVAQAASGRVADAASTARTALELARASGDRGLVSALEDRVAAFDAAVRTAPGPRR